MTANRQEPRIVSQELLNRLDPIEKIVAQRFIIEGRWIVKEKEGVSA